MDVRPATIDDIQELIRLRRVMIASVGLGGDGDWESTCAELFRTGLADGSFYAAVVDNPDTPGRLVACGVGMIAQRLPGPRNTDGRYGYVQSMATDKAHRGQGFARAVFADLMRWFEDQDVTAVDLHASAMGEPLYRQFGFTDAGGQPELRWRRTPRS